MKYFEVFRILRYLDIAIAVMSMARSAVVCSIVTWRPDLFPPRPPIAFLSPSHAAPISSPPPTLSLPLSPKAPPQGSPPPCPLGGDRRKKPLRARVRAANRIRTRPLTHSLTPPPEQFGPIRIQARFPRRPFRALS